MVIAKRSDILVASYKDPYGTFHLFRRTNDRLGLCGA